MKRWLVTAFGPFDGREENASEMALREWVAREPGLRWRILPVDAVVAPARLRAALREVRPEVLVMLGEAAGSKVPRLEEKAWNEADFRIPDAVGRLWTGRQVVAGGAAWRSAGWRVDELAGSLEGQGWKFERSQDPGRYLCNLVSYVAFDFLEREGVECLAGFVHLPLAAQHETRKSVDFLQAMARHLGS